MSSSVSSSTYTTPTGMTGAGGGDMLRLVGLNSGLDVDSIVKKMMAVEQTKIDKVKQQQQLLQWRQDAYKDIISSVRDLQSTYFDSLNSDTYILSSNFFSDYNTTSTDSTIATAAAGVGAQIGTYSISFKSDGQLAESAKITGNALDSSTTASTTMSSLGVSSDILELNCNGNQYKVSINLNDRISDVINKISTSTNGTVAASFSELTDKFTLQTSETGSSQTLTISNDVLSALGLTTGTSSSGKDAIVYIAPPGTTDIANATRVTRSTNTFTIDNITYNLIKKGDTSITVTQDADKVYKKISDFIDKYNSVIDKIQTKLNEKQDSNNKYAPLTDSQKSQMSASEISAWEDKAKVGILNNDDNLENLLNDLRSAFTSNVSGNILTFGTYGTNPIGIDTYNDYKQGDKLYISDKTKLMNAINNHIDQLSSFFIGTSDLTDKTSKYNAEGVFTRINDILVNNVGNVSTYMNSAVLTKYANFQDDYSIYGAGDDNTLPDQIYNQKLLFDKLNDEYSTKQESYYNQFSALETAMETLNEQSNYLSNILG